MEGESDSTGNERATLSAKIRLLEVDLHSQNEHFDTLKKERDTLKSQYEKEVEDSDDVINIMRQNLEHQVTKILDLKEKQLTLKHKIDAHEGRLKMVELEMQNQLAEEEENLTRDVVILQTKLLISEGNLRERDKLLAEMSMSSVSMALKKQKYDRELQEIEKKMAEEYEKTHLEMSKSVKKLSNDLSKAAYVQQVSALKEMQENIVHTFAKFRKASRLMLELLDQNKQLRIKRNKMKTELASNGMLAESLSDKVNKAGKDIISIIEQYEKENTEKTEKLQRTKQHEKVLKDHVEKLKEQLCEAKDNVAEIKEDLRDQERYMLALTESKTEKSTFEKQLAPLAKMAEDIVLKGTVELPEETEDSFERNTRLQEVATILLESSRLEHEMRGLSLNMSGIEERNRFSIDMKSELYETGAMGLLQRVSSSRFPRKKVERT